MPVEDLIRSYAGGAAQTSDQIGPESLPDAGPSYMDMLDRSTISEPRLDNLMSQKEEMGTLMKIFDVLSRGQYATVGAVQAYRHNQDIVEGFWEGLQGETKGSWIDIMDEIAPGWHPWARTGVGFVGDVVLDPINLIPAAWFTKTAKLLKLDKGFRAIGELAHTNRAVQQVGRMFVPGYDLKKIKVLTDADTGKVLTEAEAMKMAPDKVRQVTAYDRWKDLQLRLNDVRRHVRREFEGRWDQFRKIAIKLGHDPDKAAAQLVKQYEHGALPEEILPEYQELYEQVARGLEQLTEAEVQRGILDTKVLRENYFPHILERGVVEVGKDGNLVVKKQKGFFTKLGFRDTPFYARGRDFDTVEELKRYLVDLNEKGQVTELAPIDNFFRGYAIRRFVGESAVAWRDFVDEALETFGTRLDDMFEKTRFDYEGYDLAKAAKAETIEDTIVELHKAYLAKGMSMVTAVPNLRAPKLRGLALKQMAKELTEGGKPTKAVQEMLEKESAGYDLIKLFEETGGKGLVEVDPETAIKIAKGGGGNAIYFIPSDFAREIKDTFKVFGADRQTKAFLRGYDSLMHMWKSMATSMRLPFHSRNALSNTWLQYLAGVNPANMVRFGAKAGLMQFGKGSYRGFAADELIELADRFGVRAYGWLGADVPTQFQKELRISQVRHPITRKMGFGENPYNLPAFWARGGRRVGTFIEDNARLSVFLDQMGKLGIEKKAGETLEQAMKRNANKIEDASKHVRKYLFDYTELTDFERRVMKRGIPFYTWLRKNIPLQLERLVQDPKRYARLADFQHAFWPDTAKSPTEEQAYKYSWMGKENYFRSPWKTDAGKPIYYKVDLPTEELERFWRVQTWLGALTPAASMLYIAANVRVWPKPGVLAEPGQKEKAPFYAAYFPNWLAKWSGVEPILDRRTGKMTVGMDPEWKYALKTAFPFLGDWDRAFPHAGQLVDEDEKELAAFSYVTGIKARAFDMQKEGTNLAFKALRAKENVSRAARKQRLTPEEIVEIIRETMEP